MAFLSCIEISISIPTRIFVSPSLAAYDGPAADYDAALEFIKKTFIGKNIFEESIAILIK